MKRLLLSLLFLSPTVFGYNCELESGIGDQTKTTKFVWEHGQIQKRIKISKNNFILVMQRDITILSLAIIRGKKLDGEKLITVMIPSSVDWFMHNLGDEKERTIIINVLCQNF